MDYHRLTAPCGLDCFNCVVYAASSDPELRQKLAQAMGLPVEKAQCQGCREEDGKITMTLLGMSEPCSIFGCAAAKEVEFCCDCDDFPCDRLHPYADRADQIPHNTKVFNLCLIKKMGLSEWAASKAKSVRDTYRKGKFSL